MYTPKYYKVSDLDEIKDFIQQNSFGTLITPSGGKPVATHLPMQLSEVDGDLYITGHMAYGNPQWKSFKDDEDVLVIFQGSHAYISSSWYEKENVPTWNYQAVHLYGAVQILDEEELKQDLTGLLEKYEKHRENPVLWDKLSGSLLKKELKGIVGFKVKVNDIQAAYKMSQNRNETDYANIIEKLRDEKNPNSIQMAMEMKKKL